MRKLSSGGALAQCAYFLTQRVHGFGTDLELAGEGEVAECRLELLPHQGRKVHVPTGVDYAKLRGASVGAFLQIQRRHDARLQQRGNRHGTRWLNDDFHALPDQTRHRDDLLLADQEDAFHMTPQDRKRPR